jgi:hypothetical protein
MRIIDAEPQLVSDILEEMENIDSKQTDAYAVYVGRHELLGRMVVVVGQDNHGMIVELE